MGNRGSKAARRNWKRASSKVDSADHAPKEAPVGEWVSPITSEVITTKAAKLSCPSIRQSDGGLLWLEGRPEEAGRSVLVARPPAAETARDVTPGTDSGFNVRTTVHEYGGGEYLLVGDTVYFSNFKDQALYAQDVGQPGAAPRLLTRGSAERKMRFADACWDATRRLLLAVCEQHPEDDDPAKVKNFIVAIDAESGAVTTLVDGADFYSSPRLSPDGRWLAWVQWDFPNMPWDHTQLMLGEIRSGPVTEGAGGAAATLQLYGQPLRLAGASGSAVQQPVWAPDGSALYWVDDVSGFWNLYRWELGPSVSAAAGAEMPPIASSATSVCPMEAEFGLPPWVFGTSTYKVLADGSVLALYCPKGEPGMALGVIRPGQPTPTPVNTGLSSFGSPAVLRVHQPQREGPLALVVVGGSPSSGAAVRRLQVASLDALLASSPSDWEVLRTASATAIPEGYLSLPEAVAFPTTFDGKPATAHMVYYPPANKDYKLPAGQLPPLLVKSHGGPTSSAAVVLSPQIQYWTSRGFAVADVDYGGSTGYGRDYRNRLQGRWGLVDVQDCCAAAEHLVQQQQVDPKRLCISGGSAGGYTTLACLAFRRTFSAGASLYGVADLRALAEHTHKFESRYLDLLVGRLPDDAATYEARSPLAHADGFASPVVFFQGDEDRVVPPEQATAMYAAIKAKGLPTALVMFQGEQHGFRQAANIRRCLDGELFFYGCVLGFPATMPADLPPIDIDNLPAKASVDK